MGSPDRRGSDDENDTTSPGRSGVFTASSLQNRLTFFERDGRIRVRSRGREKPMATNPTLAVARRSLLVWSGSILAAVVFAMATAPMFAQEVLTRERLGPLPHDLTFIGSGAFANHVVIADGLEIRAIPARGRGLAPRTEPGRPPRSRKLFDVRDAGMTLAPRGLAFVDSERSFFLTSEARERFDVVGPHGESRGTRTIRYVAHHPPQPLTLAYIPQDSPVYPDHLLLLSSQDGPCVSVVRRDGQVVQDIHPELPGPPRPPSSITFLRPDLILFGIGITEWAVMDFDGNVLETSETIGLQGFVQLPDGRVVAAGVSDGMIHYYDATLAPRPAEDRYFGVGLGLIAGESLTWNDATNEHVMVAGPDLLAVPTTLDRVGTIADLYSHGEGYVVRDTAYMPDEQLYAVGQVSISRLEPHSIAFYDDEGQRVDIIRMVGLAPSTLAYVPPTREFAVWAPVSFLGPPFLFFLDRAGAFSRLILLEPLGIERVDDVAYFDTDGTIGGGRLMIVDGRLGEAVVTDLDGNLIDRFDTESTLAVLTPGAVSAITSGPQAGSFGMLDAANRELVVFGTDAGDPGRRSSSPSFRIIQESRRRSDPFPEKEPSPLHPD